MRHHELFVGELVFDCEKHLFGEIVKITKNRVTLNQGKYTDLNKFLFDLDAEDDPDMWTTRKSACYQLAKDKVDAREWNPVCYEHDDSIDYPYYSPTLDENLYEMECVDTDVRIFSHDMWDVLMGNKFMTKELFNERYGTDEDFMDFGYMRIGDFEITIRKVQKDLDNSK